MAKKRKVESEQKRSVGYVMSADFDNLCVSDYVSLDKNPEIMTACKKIAELIGSMTIYLMENTSKGDVRIMNELSRKIDIDPIQTMTRSHWMQTIVMNMLLYGQGNSIVVPHTYGGIIQSLEPISASRVSFVPKGNSYRDYYVLIDGIQRRPSDLLHFVYNPDKYYLWMGQGIQVVAKDIAKNLKQATETKNAFMGSKWKPALIVKVDGLVDEFSTKEGRQKILEDYVKASNVGEPWLVPSEQFQIEQVKPLSLKDLAIEEGVELDKRTVAALLGVPPFVLGVGSFNREEWNNFISTTIMTLVKAIEQEMTRKLILNPKWYLRLNVLSLLDYDLSTIAAVYTAFGDRGWVNGNEARDRIGMSPVDGLDEYKVLENYIAIDQSSLQKKIVGND
jgi:HK97 family phage portal protein